MARYVRIVMLALAIALVLPSVVRSANREYHSHGYQGAPDVGNWAWKNWSSGKHGWWMKQHWVQGSGSYGELRNGHGFEMEWYDGGNKTKCDIFEINPMSVHFWGSGITPHASRCRVRRRHPAAHVACPKRHRSISNGSLVKRGWGRSNSTSALVLTTEVIGPIQAASRPRQGAHSVRR
jgi:hypothetical protein